MEKINNLLEVLLNTDVQKKQLQALSKAYVDRQVAGYNAMVFGRFISRFDLRLKDNVIILVLPYDEDKVQLSYISFKDTSAIHYSVVPGNDFVLLLAMDADEVLDVLLEQYKKVKPDPITAFFGKPKALNQRDY